MTLPQNEHTFFKKPEVIPNDHSAPTWLLKVIANLALVWRSTAGQRAARFDGEARTARAKDKTRGLIHSSK